MNFFVETESLSSTIFKIYAPGFNLFTFKLFVFSSTITFCPNKLNTASFLTPERDFIDKIPETGFGNNFIFSILEKSSTPSDDVRTKETSSTLIDESTVLRRILAVTLAAAGISCVLTTCSQTPVFTMV